MLNYDYAFSINPKLLHNKVEKKKKEEQQKEQQEPCQAESPTPSTSNTITVVPSSPRTQASAGNEPSATGLRDACQGLLLLSEQPQASEQKKDQIKEKRKRYREQNRERSSQYWKTYKEKNKDQLREKAKRYREQNKEKIKEIRKKYYQENREKTKQYLEIYYQENKEKVDEQRRIYYQENKEKIKEQKKKHYQENKEKMKEQKKKYYQENKKEINERRKIAYQKKKEARLEQSSNLQPSTSMEIEEPKSSTPTTPIPEEIATTSTTLTDQMAESLQQSKISLMSGEDSFDIPTQLASLESLQGVFLNSIHQAENMMNRLALEIDIYKTQKNILDESKKQLNKVNILSSKKIIPSKPSNNLLSTAHLEIPTLHTFGTNEQNISNLEYKNQTGHVGFIMDHPTLIPITFLYDYNKQLTDNYSMLKENHSIGMSRSTIQTHNLSAGTSWNTSNPGLTGCIVVCHAWGNIKNIRYANQKRERSETKGNTTIRTKGSYIHIGYNIPVAKTLLITPYIGNSYITMDWNPYVEYTRVSPCSISKYSEKYTKKYIELRTSWDITNKARLQLWMAKTFGKHTTGKIHSSLQKMTPNPLHNITVKSHKKKFIQTEFGMFCKLGITEQLDLNLNTTFSTHKNTSGDQVTLSFKHNF